MGQSRGRARARARDNDRLEANCGNGRRKNRQGTPDLWSGGGRRNNRYVHYRRSRLVRLTGKYDARSIVWRGWNEGRQSFGLAVEHGAQSCHGVGVDAAGINGAGGLLILDIPEGVLSEIKRAALACRQSVA